MVSAGIAVLDTSGLSRLDGRDKRHDLAAETRVNCKTYRDEAEAKGLEMTIDLMDCSEEDGTQRSKRCRIQRII